MRTMGPFLWPASSPQMAPSSTCPFSALGGKCRGGKGALHTFSTLLLHFCQQKAEKTRKKKRKRAFVESCESAESVL